MVSKGTMGTLSSTQREKAKELGISYATIKLWKTLPEISQMVTELNVERLMELVGPATALMEQAIRKPGSISRVSFDAARYVVQDWGRRSQAQTGVAQTIADLLKKYQDA